MISNWRMGGMANMRRIRAIIGGYIERPVARRTFVLTVERETILRMCVNTADAAGDRLGSVGRRWRLLARLLLPVVSSRGTHPKTCGKQQSTR